MPARTRIVFIGRTNREKRFAAFERLARELAASGHQIDWFASKRTQASARIDQRIAAWWPGLADASGWPAWQRARRWLAKAMLALAAPERREFLRFTIAAQTLAAARDLAAYLSRLPDGPVCLIGHSAGAIAATRVANHPRVGAVMCLGYAFRHPERLPQCYRTNHLPGVTRPLLIVQGVADQYGPEPERFVQFLPSQYQLVRVDTDHDYAPMSDADFDRLRQALDGLLQCRVPSPPMPG